MSKCNKCTLKATCSSLCLTCIYNKYALTGLDNNFVKMDKKIEVLEIKGNTNV